MQIMHIQQHTNFYVRALTDIFGSPGRPPAALGAYFHIPNTQLTVKCTQFNTSVHIYTQIVH